MPFKTLIYASGFRSPQDGEAAALGCLGAFRPGLVLVDINRHGNTLLSFKDKFLRLKEAEGWVTLTLRDSATFPEWFQEKVYRHLGNGQEVRSRDPEREGAGQQRNDTSNSGRGNTSNPDQGQGSVSKELFFGRECSV